ncbi:hypothetical protein AC249_AIPGENE23728 [Exaiptasia diaphana]|nr:hypothetical protein AC249_AIPGENE23728 [Exaiptasia diaphana]
MSTVLGIPTGLESTFHVPGAMFVSTKIFFVVLGAGTVRRGSFLLSQEVPFARDGQYPLALSKAGLDFRQVEFLLEVGAQRQQQHVFLAQEDEMDRIPNLIIPYGWADFRRRQHPPHPNPVPQHNVQPG